MKVFITGLGSDLGTQIARIVEHNNDVTDIAGIDMFPPRRYLSRTKFFLSHYDDSERITEVIDHFEPDVIINFGVYEPGARLSFSRARGATHASVSGITHALKKRPNIHVITRSSLVVYGFSDPQKIYDETSPLSPDTLYGQMCRDVEEELLAHTHHVTIVRTAPEIGSHVPHPLARILTLPVVPLQARLPFSNDPGFPVISPRDAVDIFVRCISLKNDEPVRILHAATAHNAKMTMAVTLGKKIPLFSAGIGFSATKQLSYLLGAPIDPHIEMLIRRGLKIDSTSTRMHFGITSQDSAVEVVRDLYRGEEKSIDSTVLTEIHP